MHAEGGGARPVIEFTPRERGGDPGGPERHRRREGRAHAGWSAEASNPPKQPRDIGCTDSAQDWTTRQHSGRHWTHLAAFDGNVVLAYFTRAADWREGEKKQPRPELAAQMAELEALMHGTEFVNLGDLAVLS